jgi:hypothetical protein
MTTAKEGNHTFSHEGIQLCSLAATPKNSFFFAMSQFPESPNTSLVS